LNYTSVTRDNLTSSFPIWILVFLSLIALARNSETILNKSRKSGHFCIIPDFRGNYFSFSPFSTLAIVFSYIVSSMLRYIPSVPSFFRDFIMKVCLIFVKSFFCFYWDDHVILSFILFICCITFIDLHMLNHPWISEMKPTWS
jgi:hypothetical protein